jgi:RNA polymerase sigma factor (sigma-70 family)
MVQVEDAIETQTRSTPGGTSAVTSASFARFFDAEFAQLYRALVIVTRDTAEAEDLAQEAFGRMWERWDRVSTLQDPQGYLYRTALNGYFQRRRKAARFAKRVLDRSYADAERDPLSLIEARDLVERSLLSLTARQRAALVVTELLGHDSVQAAAILGVRPGTVRMLVSQAKARLRNHKEEGQL